MNAIDALEQAIGSEYLLDDTQRENLLSELKRYENSSEFSELFYDKQPQPHTNKIVGFN